MTATWRNAGWREQGQEPEGASTLGSVLTLVDGSMLEGQETWAYWAARAGRAGHTYLGAHVPLGAGDYVWWSVDAVGLDPGFSVPALEGLTGHEVELVSTELSAAEIATATALVIATIDGWAAVADGAEVEIQGPEAVTTGAGWDAGTPGAMVGMRSITGTHEGPVADALAQFLPAPDLDLPLVAVDILIGTVADDTDRWRGAIYTGVGGSASPVGEDRVIDLGQLAADQVMANTWARWYLPADADIRGTDDVWLAVKGEGGITTVRGVLSGNALRGDWPNANLLASDQGEASPMDPDATVAWPATWTGTIAVESGFVMGIRLVFARPVGDASHHSEADPAIWGVHADPGELGSTIDFDSNLAVVGLSPAIEGMRLLDLGFAVGAARGTQPRVGVFTGGQAYDPDAPDPDGATLLVDGGRLTGSSTTAWEYRSLGGIAWPASTQTAWWTKNNDATTGTNIAFAQDPSQANASPPETPMDFAQAESDPGPAQGPEYEIFPADSAYNVTNPAVTFVSPFVADPDDARPRNIPGARLRFWVPGITVTSG